MALLFSFNPISESPDPEAGLVMLFYYPLGLFLASMLTGFLCGLTVENKLALFVIAPGLYFPCLCPCLLFSSLLPYVLLMYPVSLAGTALGYLLMYLLKKLMEKS